MKAAVYRSNADVRIEDVPEPRAPGLGDLLLRVDACGVCGSDTLEWYRKPKAPLVLGHETVGTVLQAGAGSPFREGERVFASHHVPCLTCPDCLKGHEAACDLLRSTHLEPGGFAERCRVPAVNVQKGGVLRIPDAMTDLEAVFVEPLGCVVRGQRAAGLQPGDGVLVLGSGAAGLLHLRLAKALGAGPLVATDTNPVRLAAAEASGALPVPAQGDVVGAVRKALGGRLADVVLVCTGAPAALRQAAQCVQPGGSVLWFAPAGPEQRLDLPFNELWRNEVRFASSYAAAPRDLRQSLALLAARRVRVEDLVTHALPLAEAQRAFTLVAEAKEGLKVVLRPNAPA
jgi:L-iditol 2-dehydrogenase